jgi:hypothetical protein
MKGGKDMAKIGNEAKLVLKLAEERIKAANLVDDATATCNSNTLRQAEAKARIRGRDEALAILKDIHLEMES